MALDPVTLDDLDWRSLVEAIRRRIPAASDGQWTLHAPVDPGVTLLELFAWQLEQRLFRMDQVPEPLDRALLALHGVRPRRVRSARTVMQISRLPVEADDAAAAAVAAATVVARRTAFTLDGSAPPVVYTTMAPLALLPLATPAAADPPSTRVWIAGRDRSADLQAGRVIRLFPADGGEAEVRFEFELDGPPPEAGDAGFGLWLSLRTPGALAPSWSPDAVAGVPPLAVLTWSYRAGDGKWRRFDVDDGTGGLRRSGLVRLRVPADWRAEADSGRWALSLSTARASFSAPPRLVAVVPNAVLARHAREVVVPASTPMPDWLPLPGNTIALEASPLTTACVLDLRERDGHWHRWWPIESLQACGPADRRFVIDRELARLRFGDGLNGRLPVLMPNASAIPGVTPPPTPRRHLRYLCGGGPAGNVGPSPAGRPDWTAESNHVAAVLTDSLGGDEAETLSDARLRAAALLRLPTRAVTADDCEAIALATPGVALRRAHVSIGRHPSQPCGRVAGAVTVILVPDVPREDLDPDRVEVAFVATPQPDPGLLAAVGARLDAARLVGTELFVRGPRYRAVRLSADLRGTGDAAALRAAMTVALRDFLDPLTGGDDGTGWPFGEPVRAAVMLRELQAAAGAGVRVDAMGMGLDGAEPAESCRALEIGPDDLVWLQSLRVRLTPAASPVEGLR